MERMKMFSRGFALAVMVTVVVGCAAGQAGPPNSGTGGSSTGGSTGTAGAASGTGGSAGCASPPIVELSWTLMSGSSKVTCDQANVKYVEFFMDTAHTQFNCVDGQGMSADFSPGSYTARVWLTDASNQVVFQGSATKLSTVPSCGVASIGNFSIPVQLTGAAGSGGSGGTAGSGGGGSTGTGGGGGSTGTGGSGGSSGTGGASGGTGPCNALPIFAVHSCAAMACHDASGTSANFNMASPGWENNLVGKGPKAGGASGLQSSCLSAGKQYLMANTSPAQGLFLDKLKMMKPECGSQMPLLPPTLSASELDCVQRWANGLTKP
jgi:hypothetical protein